MPLLRIPAKVILQNAGRTVEATALVDTGAEVTVLDSPISTKLNLKLGRQANVRAVGGGSVVTWPAFLENISIKGNPACSVGNLQVRVAKLGIPGADLLLGEDFINPLRPLDFKFREGQPLIVKCGGGPAVAVFEPFPIDIVLIAGIAVIAGVAVFLILN